MRWLGEDEKKGLMDLVDEWKQSILHAQNTSERLSFKQRCSSHDLDDERAPSR